jgi:lycopene cyclase domain-containing protein
VTLLYLAGLLVGLAGMVVLDLRFVLFFRRAPLRAGIVLAVGIAFFLAWDLAGIRLDIFFPGASAIVTGVMLAPGLPLEEVFFLALLCYSTMNAYGWFARGASGTGRSAAPSRPGPGEGA